MRVALPRLAVLAALSVAACMVLAVASPLPGADGVGAPQQTLVSGVPGTNTPNITNGAVRSMTQVGQWIVAAGSFTAAASPGSSAPVSRSHVLAFDADTGVLAAGFAPSVNGSVNTVIRGQTPNTVYIGGDFTTVNGVPSRNLAMVNLADGFLVSGFRPAALNGAVQDMRLSGGRLYVVGGFTTAGGVSHQGIATLNPKTGAVDPFMNVRLTDHHNYSGTGAKGSLGGRALDISPDGSRAVVVGNFKHADGALHDQIVMLDLTGTSASVRANWNTAAFSAACAARSFDTYVRDVDFSPDGSYFAVVTTGASTFSTNTDGTRSLCDSASRWETNTAGSNIRPTWVDYTGNDSLWSVACTGSAIYAGGHQRWANNPNGSDRAAAGAIARPGIMALDPLNGMPMAWNPGRNPRGAGAYALLATNTGLYVGSDTDYIGNFRYKRQKIAYLPIDGGETPPSTVTTQLPGRLYLTGPTNSSAATSLIYRSVDRNAISAPAAVSSDIKWDGARGVFRVGNTVFYGATDGTFHGVSFDGTTIGTPTTYDPYDDPVWDSVSTGSGQTYQGMHPTFFAELPSVTGAFYWKGRMYYTLQKSTSLFWRYFEPDDGAIGGEEFTVAGVDLPGVAGMVLSGSTIYYADSTDGTLHTLPFANGVPDRAEDKVISGPLLDGNDWRARGMFILGNQPPTAVARATCSHLVCTFDGSPSTDPDGDIVNYRWAFGDSTAAVGETVRHTYTAQRTYHVTLTLRDNDDASATWSGLVSPTRPIEHRSSIRYVGQAHFKARSIAPYVAVPRGISAGDTELLFLSTGTTTKVLGLQGIVGWDRVATIRNGPLVTNVFQRTGRAGDSGRRVTARLSERTRVTLQFLDYSGVALHRVRLRTALDTHATKLVAPAMGIPVARSWVLRYWAARSPSNRTWSLPSTVRPRSAALSADAVAVSSVLADSGPISAGRASSATARLTGRSSRDIVLSLVLAPRSTG